MNVCRTAGLLSALLLAACATKPVSPVPVVDRSTPQGAAAGKPVANNGARAPQAGDGKTWVVKPGDTLYSIALENGLDYKEIAAWNQLADVNLIKVDQVLRLTEPAEAVAATTSVPVNGVVIKPLKSDVDLPAPSAAGVVPSKPATAPGTVATVNYPKSLKLSYSSDAATVARQAEGPVQTAALAKPLDAGKPTEAKPQEIKPQEPKPQDSKPAEKPTAGGEEDIAWSWPTAGKVITPFSETAKGLDIGGKLGQPVLAAGSGRVVYAGSGLRGYGKLVIIKHNKTYLSAYAHNNQLLVKEGDNVKKGDKIAEMGNSDAEQVKLHFEIRRFGKPVDPSKYLTAG